MVAGADDTLKQNCGITNTDYYNYLNGTDVSCSRSIISIFNTVIKDNNFSRTLTGLTTQRTGRRCWRRWRQ